MSTAQIIAELPRLTSSELAEVQAKLAELAQPAPEKNPRPIAAHPAFGIWGNRTDLPEDSAEASKQLREQMMRRTDAAK